MSSMGMEQKKAVYKKWRNLKQQKQHLNKMPNGAQKNKIRETETENAQQFILQRTTRFFYKQHFYRLKLAKN